MFVISAVSVLIGAAAAGLAYGIIQARAFAAFVRADLARIHLELQEHRKSARPPRSGVVARSGPPTLPDVELDDEKRTMFLARETPPLPAFDRKTYGR
jgi:hypothetical protein